MYFPPDHVHLLNEPLVLHEGHLNVVLANKNDKTYIEKRYSENPLSISNPLYITPGMAYFYLINTSGGLVQGDRLNIGITLKENCFASITTQSATKIYRMEQNCAVQYTSIKLEKNSYLEYLPDANIPYKDSRFFQFIDIKLNKSSTFFFQDILYPGRYERREVFENDIFYSNLKIYLNGELSLIDTAIVQPNKQNPKNIGIMGNKKFTGNLYLFSANYELIERELHDVNYGINPSGILVIRLLEDDWLTMKQKIEEIWRMVRITYLHSELPPIRKY